MDIDKKLHGLTAEQVRKKTAQGFITTLMLSQSSSNWEIFRRNVFNLFNFLNFIIALALIAVNAWSNSIFFCSYYF